MNAPPEPGRVVRPGAHPAFQALCNELSQAFEQYADIRGIATQAGLDLGGIVLENVAPRTAWSNVLEAAWKAQRIPALVAAALAQPNVEAFREPLTRHRDALLAALANGGEPPDGNWHFPWPLARRVLAGAGILLLAGGALFLVRHALFPSCADGARDGAETDVDCGGAACAKCADLRGCDSGADCLSGACAGNPGVCQAASCGDHLKNGEETDVDCGGHCAPCAADRSCALAADCASRVCVGARCQSPVCNDGVRNGTETDVDCGGGCRPCAVDHGCALAADCESGVCVGGRCQSPTCNDSVRNGAETDVDCGESCAKCAVGKKCGKPQDCASLVCTKGTCQAGASGKSIPCMMCPKGCDGLTRQSAPPSDRGDCQAWVTCDGSCKK